MLRLTINIIWIPICYFIDHEDILGNMLFLHLYKCNNSCHNNNVGIHHFWRLINLSIYHMSYAFRYVYLLLNWLEQRQRRTILSLHIHEDLKTDHLPSVFPYRFVLISQISLTVSRKLLQCTFPPVFYFPVIPFMFHNIFNYHHWQFFHFNSS